MSVFGRLNSRAKADRETRYCRCLQALLVEVLADFLPSGRSSNSFHVLNSLTHLLGAVNSSVNFLFYCALGSRYRATLRSLCCGGRRRHRGNHGNRSHGDGHTATAATAATSDSGAATVVETVEQRGST